MTHQLACLLPLLVTLGCKTEDHSYDIVLSSSATDTESSTAPPATEPGGSNPSSEPGPTSSTTDATATDPTGETTDTDGDTEASDPDAPGFDALGLCEPEVCPSFTQPYAEGEPYGGMGAECTFTGLRDGTPGRYTYRSEHEFGNGHEDATVHIVMHADRTVTLAIHRERNTDEDGLTEAYEPTQTCTLVDAAFFDDCLLGNTDLYECVWTDSSPWWTACAPSAATCG